MLPPAGDPVHENAASPLAQFPHSEEAAAVEASAVATALSLNDGNPAESTPTAVERI